MEQLFKYNRQIIAKDQLSKLLILFITFMQDSLSFQRHKQLSPPQLHKLKHLPQYLPLDNNHFILYNIVDKQSNSGLFTNQRLLLLNTKQQTLFYLSKTPPGLLPFAHEDEVNNLQCKQKISSNESSQNGENKFLCQKRVQKNAIQLRLNTSKRTLSWIFYFGSHSLMEEWFQHVHLIFTKSRQQVDEKYHPKPLIQPYTASPLLPLRAQLQPANTLQKNNPPQVPYRQIEASRIEQIKPLPNQKQSQFNQFQQSAPLGRFVRQNIKFNTQNGYTHNMQSLELVSPRSQGKNVVPEQVQRILDSHRKGNKRSFQTIKQRQQDWQALYYSSVAKAETYFAFIRQATHYVKQFVDSLPVTKSIDQFDKIGPFYSTSFNGIHYKIAFLQDQQSLIYQLSDQSHPENNHYKIYQQLKIQFYEYRRLFSSSKEGKPPLSCFIDYKGLSFLCKSSLTSPASILPNSHLSRANTNQDTILHKLLNLQLFIVSSADFQDIMRYLNSAWLSWGYMYSQTSIKPFRVQFLNEMFSEVFANILRGQLCHIYHSSLLQTLASPQIVVEAVNDSIIMLVNRLFGKGNESDQLWEIVLLEVQRKYGLQATTEDIIPGYLLYSVIYKLGIEIKQGVNMKNTFILFKNNKSLQKDHVVGLRPKVFCLNFEMMSPLFQQIKKNLQSVDENNEQLQLLTSNQQYELIPQYVNYLAPKIKIQLSKSKPYDESGKNILIYSSLPFDTPTSNNYEIVLSAINWLLTADKYQQAKDLAFIKIEELIFWAGKVPIISLFYQCFADYYLASQQYQKGIEQIKLSVKNLSQIFGPSSSKLLAKKKELSSIYLSLNRKQHSLKELYQCKTICENNKYDQSSVYIQILTKIAKLNLFLGKYGESISNCMSCLKQLQLRVDSQDLFAKQESASQFLEVGQILLRAFELTNKREEIFEVISLCAQRCQNVNSLRVYKRLFKIVLFPFLKRLSLKESQVYMMIVQQLNTAYKLSSLREQQLYTCIKQRRLLADISQRLKNSFKNLSKFHDEITKKKLLQDVSYIDEQYFRCRSDRNQVQAFIRETFLMSNLIGIGFIQGMLKDVYYE